MSTTIQDKLEGINWEKVADDMNRNGFSVIKEVIDDKNCQELINNYANASIYRKTVKMERYKFGEGEYKYYAYPLPNIVQQMREFFYPKLVSIANEWMKMLNIETIFSESFAEFQKLCHANNQTKPTPLILKYNKGGYNTLHQDIYGSVFFPIQIAMFLSHPEQDYTGGEFILTEQVPRSQSKATVLRPNKGDILIFTTNFRPEKGIKGYYRVHMRHGISKLISGERYVTGVIFHDAIS